MRNKSKIEQDVPEYLKRTYWWAYLHPRSVRIFERQWLVNLILFGNYKKLRDALIQQVDVKPGSRSLQVACAYGDFTETLLDRLGEECQLDVVDVARIQIENLRNKLESNPNPSCRPGGEKVFLHKQDSTSLDFDDNTFDNVILFFLLHEQPKEVREKTVQEAERVCKTGGRIVCLDYHKPDKGNILRFLLDAVLSSLEPYALEFREGSLESLFEGERMFAISKQTYFKGFYQRLVLEKQG